MADGGSAEATAESCVASLSALHARAVPRSDLPGLVVTLERLRNVVNALSAEVLHEYEQDGGWALEGALSAAAWTAQRTGSARAGLRSRVRQGAALARLPKLAVPALAGRLSVEHLGAVAECAHRYPELAAEHEDLLVEQAEALGAEGFRVAARHWLAAAEDNAETTPAAPEPVSHLHVARSFKGWLHVDGLFAPGEDADLVEAAFGAGMDRAVRARRDGDPALEGQTLAELQAGVLVDLAAQSMRHEPSDASVPDRYRIAVVVRAGEATQPAGAACDAAAYRVTLGAEGELLDVGRQTRQWPTAIRRAVTVRDRECVFPGCDRPPSWCDIHHCTAWEEDGETAVDNGALLCRRHHTFVHRQHWTVAVEDGRPVTRRPDGTPYAIERWQQPDRPAA